MPALSGSLDGLVAEIDKVQAESLRSDPEFLDRVRLLITGV